MIKTNIPLVKLDNPYFKEFLESVQGYTKCNCFGCSCYNANSDNYLYSTDYAYEMSIQKVYINICNLVAARRIFTTKIFM
jgi:hypothetical protein